jgi:site-specific DNA-cytosine methylase
VNLGVPFVVHNAQGDPNYDVDRSMALDTQVPPAIVFNWQSGGDVRLNISEYVTSALQASQVQAVSVNMAQITSPENRATVKPGQPCPTLDTRGYVDAFGPGVMGVRRLTPRECERLQGFPDDWTAGESDTARYRMLGNAVCVYQALWIGRRIVEVDRG